MPALENEFHENYAKLVANGLSRIDALKRLYPGRGRDVLAKSVMRKEVDDRIHELRMELATRAVATIEEKRDLLRRMIEGTVPTKVTKSRNGVEATYDRLAALLLDAKIAGELAADRLTVQSTSTNDLTLTFDVEPRNAPKTIDVAAEKLPPAKSEKEDLTWYEKQPLPRPWDAVNNLAGHEKELKGLVKAINEMDDKQKLS